MPTPVSCGLPVPPEVSSRSARFSPAFGSALNAKGADRFIRFGENDGEKPDVPKEKESFLKDMWGHMKGPAKIGFVDRLTALFSPTHLKAGFTSAKKTFAEIRKDGRLGLELMGMALDVVAIVFTLGIILPLDVLLPGFNVSKTLESFFGGIQLSKEAAQTARKAGKDAPDAA